MIYTHTYEQSMSKSTRPGALFEATASFHIYTRFSYVYIYMIYTHTYEQSMSKSTMPSALFEATVMHVCVHICIYIYMCLEQVHCSRLPQAFG